MTSQALRSPGLFNSPFYGTLPIYQYLPLFRHFYVFVGSYAFLRFSFDFAPFLACSSAPWCIIILSILYFLDSGGGSFLLCVALVIFCFYVLGSSSDLPGFFILVPSAAALAAP